MTNCMCGKTPQSFFDLAMDKKYQVICECGATGPRLRKEAQAIEGWDKWMADRQERMKNQKNANA